MAATKAALAYAFALLGVIIAVAAPAKMAFAQDLASQLVGVWKRTSMIEKELATGTTSTPEIPDGPVIFTRGGRFAWVILAPGRKAPAAPIPTDAERAALWATGSFGTGTYRLEGDKVVLRYDTSWNQLWTGTERRADMKVTGNVLTWTSPPYPRLDGKEVVGIQTFERAE
jgi:Lipocalin-like domain